MWVKTQYLYLFPNIQSKVHMAFRKCFLFEQVASFAFSGVHDVDSLSDFSSLLPPSILQRIENQLRDFQINPDVIRRNLRVLQDSCTHNTSIVKILEEFPGASVMNTLELENRVHFFKMIGIHREGMDRIFSSYPRVLSFDIDDRLKLLFDEFNEHGFSEEEVKKAIVDYPQLLTMEIGEFSRCIRLLRNLKCRLSTRKRILCGGEFRASIEVKLRVDCLCSYGIIHREAFKILFKEPRVILYPIEDVKKKIDFLLNQFHCDINRLIDVPSYLGVNFEKRIICRYNVIQHLKSIGAIGTQLSLKNIVNLSKLKFHNLYMKPYPECEKLYGRFSKVADAPKPRNSELSKLFKPHKKVQNMRGCVEVEIGE